MNYTEILKKIFSHEAIIVIIKGYWKTGKTNVGLRIIEDLLYLGLIKIAGTNIKIKETDKIKFIEDFETLKEFHFDDPINPKHKAFIFDEAGKITVKRKAMGQVNVGWMQFIPELSKGRMKLIVITQAEYLTDSIFTQTEFTRAIITTYHHETHGYSISIESELIEPNFVFINKFKKCKTYYSPYASAEWFMDRRTQKKEVEMLCCKVAKMYALDKPNKSTVQIANELGLSTRTAVIRLLKRHIRHTFNSLTEDDKKEIYKEMKDKENVLE